MDNRQNIIAMMVLGAMIVALGGTIVSGEMFEEGRPEKMGYVVEGVEEPTGGTAVAKVDIATLLPTADAAKGAEVFKKCASCHTIAQGGANGIGPNLWALFAKPHGHVPGFAYSDALKSKPGNWDFINMDAWLTSPKAYAPGTKMSFAGLSKPEDRANLLVYLNAQGSNIPLPAPTTAPAPAEGAADGNVTEAAPAGNVAEATANAAQPATP